MTAHADESDRPDPRGGESAKVPFDARFFAAIFPDRLQAACPREGGEIPVVLLDLADGRTLDLCHIDLLGPTWMAVSAFREKDSCDEMDNVFVPYEMIALVTISRRDPSQRRVGFQADRVLEWPRREVAAAAPKEGHACKPLART